MSKKKSSKHTTKSSKKGSKKKPQQGGGSQGTRRIEHFVVLMLENRSFDHIFGFRQGINGLKGNEFNLLDPSKPESDTNPATFVSATSPYAILAGKNGPSHSLKGTNVQLSNDPDGPTAQKPAKNNGFVRNYRDELFGERIRNPTKPELAVVMDAFSPAQLPSINALADAFCICDNWYSEVPGPTQPNRLYMHAATSAGFAHNVWAHEFDVQTIYNNLDAAGLTWATYDFDLNEVRQNFTRVKGSLSNFKKFEALAVDVEKDALANYSFILPRFNNSAQGHSNSQHAPEDARYGDNLIADVYEALRSNDAVWEKTVLVITHDEHGGFFDHVIPPSENIPNPDGINSPTQDDHASFVPKFAFDRLGLRVPAVICSPWIKAGRVDSTRYQHTSVLATLKNYFGLPSFLTKRDASAASFEHIFEELSEPRTDTPKKLPRAKPPKTTVAPDSPMHPANQPLNADQKDALIGVFSVTKDSHPALTVGDVPSTQGDAAEFINARYKKHFGGWGEAGVRPRAHRK